MITEKMGGDNTGIPIDWWLVRGGWRVKPNYYANKLLRHIRAAVGIRTGMN